MNSSDIRILKNIGTVEGRDNGMQTELNIVSINGGEIQYDLREWSLDHDTIGDGITFSQYGASVLFALLKECFKDSGEGIDIHSIHIPDTDLLGNKEEKPIEVDISINTLLKEKGIEFVDKRENNGSLWVTGGHELDSVMLELKELGFKFTYSEKGGKQTKHKPGWYLRGGK